MSAPKTADPPSSSTATDPPTQPKRNTHSNSSRSAHSQAPIDITKDEFDRISDALKNVEFRKMFLDYVEEIQDPVNRKMYEDEIKQLEKERGVDVTFINPEPGFVVKTSADGAIKCFVNIAKSTAVAPPTHKVCTNAADGSRGLNWAIPMAQGEPRDDLDSHGKRCRVYDVSFHPDALHLAEKNSQFRKCIIDTALDAVEREFKVKLDRINLRFPKLKFKGVARPTVIRKLAANATKEQCEPHPLESIYPARPTAESSATKVLPMKTMNAQKPDFCVPKYKITHCRSVDYTEMIDAPDAKVNILVPNKLIVEIELPLLKSTAECKLDVTADSVYLLSDRAGAKYRLKLDLPYQVDDKEGSAKFDTDARCLRIHLPVVQKTPQQQRRMHDAIVNREDSGVESDGRDEVTSSERSSPIEEINEREDDVSSKAEQPEASKEPAPFLNKSIMYQFPAKFDCNVLDNVMSLVLHVRNVPQESVAVQRHAKHVHVQFTSIGSGYYPTSYAFYLQMPSDGAIQIETAEAEAWENNVVLNLQLSGSGENVHNYYAGVDGGDLKEYTVQQRFQVSSKRPSRHSSHKLSQSPPSLEISVERSDCEQSVEIEIKPRHEQNSTCAANTTEDDGAGGLHSDGQQQQQKKKSKQKKKNKKRRSLSESACDDIKAYQQEQHELAHTKRELSKCPDDEEDSSLERESPRKSNTVDVPNASGGGGGDASTLTAQQRKQRSFSECRDSVIGSSSVGSSTPYKGILKRYSRYEPRPSISDSCSSIDECSSSYSCSVEAPSRFSKSFGGIPEEQVGDGLSESCKKTVRFNEVIRRQFFRLDSSILGQRKKNQKRRDLKLKKMQRRLSEGDSADYEDNGNKPIDLASSSTSSQANGTGKPKQPTSKTSNTHHDSGLDLSQTDEATTSAVSSSKKAKTKKEKTPRPGAGGRARLESESSSDIEGTKGAMMFEMDM